MKLNVAGETIENQNEKYFQNCINMKLLFKRSRDNFH